MYCNKMIYKYEHLLIPITLSAKIHRRQIGIDTPKLIASVVESKERSLRKGCLHFRLKKKHFLSNKMFISVANPSVCIRKVRLKFSKGMHVSHQFLSNEFFRVLKPESVRYDMYHFLNMKDNSSFLN